MASERSELWEFLVPTVRNDGRPFRTRFHRVWDQKVRAIAGGLTIYAPAKGQWVNRDGKIYEERVIPVRVMCSEDQAHEIAELSLGYYDQLAFFYYRVSDAAFIRRASPA